jgi:2-C-methyl-D-erythritol 4-phosphate cytidylyltransferase/2-C-methyl-D-erythritol 2,4-cyclodiphosphate synthase
MSERLSGAKVCAIIPGAGPGERLGQSQPKAWVLLAGQPLICHSLAAFRRSPRINEIILVVHPHDTDRARELIASGPSDKTEKAVSGGATRQESVWLGLQESSQDADIVVVHDAARPFVSQQLIEQCIQQALAHGACTAAVPCSDTVKRADGNTVAQTLDRRRLWLVQTPQAFRRDLIIQGHENARRHGISDATDDAQLVERLDKPVRIVRGCAENMKITEPADMALVEALLAGGPARIGFGYDAHSVSRQRTLVLGGVVFEGEPGLEGHSDADVICHAACDALLGASGLGDLGRHFPDTDERYRGISSLKLLKEVAGMVRAAGWQLENLDVTLVAERPRIAPFSAQIRRNLAQAVGIEDARVSAKATTSEGLGFVGRREGMASYAVCSLRRKWGQPEEPPIGPK